MFQSIIQVQTKFRGVDEVSVRNELVNYLELVYTFRFQCIESQALSIN